MNFDQIQTIITDKLNFWLSFLIRMLPNFVLAVIILLLGLYISRFVRNFSRKKILKYSLTSTLSTLGVNLVYTISICLAVFLALKVLHLDGTITTVLASAGIIGIAMAFAFQDMAANFISGIFIAFNKPFGVGEVIKTGDYIGVVKEVKLRDTTLLTFEGQYVIVPNKDVFQNPIVNYSKLGKRRIDLTGGVSSGDDLRKAARIALNALKGIEGVFSDETTFLYDGLGEGTIKFTVRIWIDTAGGADLLKILDEAVVRVKEAFEQNDISLPYPIRTLDFNMKGGKTLSEMVIQLNDASFRSE